MNDDDPRTSGIRMRAPMLMRLYEELRSYSNHTFEVRAYKTNVLQTRHTVPGLCPPTKAPAQALGYVMYLPGDKAGAWLLFAECVVVEPKDAMIGLVWLMQHAIVQAKQRDIRRVANGAANVYRPQKWF